MTATSSSELPVLVLRDGVLLPRMLMPLAVGRPGSMHAVEAAAASEHKTIVVASQPDPTIDEPELADLYPFATRAVIKRLDHAEDLVQVIVQGIDRVRIQAVVQAKPHLMARVEVVTDPKDATPEADALHRAVLDVTREVATLMPAETQAVLRRVADEAHDPVAQCYLIASLVGLDPDKTRALLGASTNLDLYSLMLADLRHEASVLRIRAQIANRTATALTEDQRRALLRQQLRTIQAELGETEGEVEPSEDLRQKITAAGLPAPVLAEAERELERLKRLPQASPDHNLARSWLELIAAMPWQASEPPPISLKDARDVLDADHDGLEEVKTRILEHLAVMQLNPTAHAPILCFVGPPGVGKTSLGRSIARALGRSFERLSLGGVHDEAELRGHRRTYVGAMPGRILQAVRRAKSRNCVLMLDEVDKLGQGVHGDPAAALLEILDPAQNAEFRDNYLELPFDLSRVFFLTTANTLDTIPRPLLDRMETIRIAGYTDAEKASIARKHLLPRVIADCGLKPEQFAIEEPALQRLYQRYTQEAGVRQLERRLSALCRKAAARIASGSAERLVVDLPILRELLGPERVFTEDLRRQLEPGVAAGLAWTETGGAVLYVETVLLPQSTEMVLTGQLGEVMRESARAALSWLRSHAQSLGLDSGKITQGVHVHVPAGATPKDGPSAGVAIAIALASLYAGQAVRNDVAMTGEITLSGLVLPVGGIKEKLLAAHRMGIRTVLVPKQNEPDTSELPALVLKQLEIVFVSRVPEAMRIALPQLGTRTSEPMTTRDGSPLAGTVGIGSR